MISFMEPWENREAIFAPDGEALTWLTAYHKTRAHLASLGSDFQCDPACTRPGCKNPDLQVQISLVDLLGLARQRQEPVSVLLRRYYSLALFSAERDDWIKTAGLKLKKPCPFLKDDLCGIYPVRPLPCILFPEYLAAEGKFEAEARQEHFRDFLCFQRPLVLSPERARIMAELKKMWSLEILVTSFYLFGHGSCRLDFSNLTRELREETSRLQDGPGEEAREPGGLIPHLVLERFFLEHLAGLQPFAGMEEKIRALDKPEGQARFLRLWQDERLLNKLRQGDRVQVFRWEKGRLRVKRRSLLPGEYNFY